MAHCYIVILLLVGFGTVRCYAQTSIRIINADLFEYTDFGTRRVQTLTGNVQLEHNGTLMYCNTANLNTSENTVDASGSVVIKQDTVTIYSDNLFYNGNTRKATLTGQVRLTDNRMTLTTTQLDYDLNSRVGYYSTGGTLVNENSTLRSGIGHYYANSKDVYFKKDVHLNNPQYTLMADTLRYNINSRIAYFIGPTYITGNNTTVYCEGGYFHTVTNRMQFTTHAQMRYGSQILQSDTIEYGRRDGLGVAQGHVFWQDTARKIIITAGKALYNELTELIIASNKPEMVDVSRSDSLFLKADTLHSSLIDSSGLRLFRAFNNVEVFSNNINAICDSLTYSETDSTFHFYRDPILWVDENQLTADSIFMKLQNGNLHSVYLRQNSLIVSTADSTMFNQVRGRVMTGYFLQNQLDHLIVEGNGESVYYAREENGRPIGINKAICSRMKVIVSNNKAQRIVFYEKPEATLYPLGQAPPEELKLKGFRWEISKKPTRSLFRSFKS